MRLIVIWIIDNIIKCFQYAWFVMIPVISIIIFLLAKKIKLNKNNVKDAKRVLKVICGLGCFLLLAIFTVRFWGPNFYKIIISFSICGKEKEVEQKLETKYGKNFNYISQEKIVIEDSKNAIGQNIDNDYSVRYFFKDDDGVIAIVIYKKNYQSDYYESKRSKYEIEKHVYDYAKTVQFDKKFYIYVESHYELVSDSDLNDEIRSNSILEKRNSGRIILILTEPSDENQRFIVSALKTIFDKDDNFYVHEHVVTEDEYEKAVSFYNSISSQIGIADYDYEEYFDFNKNNQIQFKYYFII